MKNQIFSLFLSNFTFFYFLFHCNVLTSQTVLYQETFPSTVFTSGGWTVSGQGSSSGSLTPADLWLHDTDGPSGYYANPEPIIASNSVGDGFLILDGDYFNGFGSMPTVSDYFNAEAVSPVYDVSGNSIVLVKFTQAYNMCCTFSGPNIFLDVSTDGFSSFTSFDVMYSDAPINVISGTRDYVIDVSSFIASNPSNFQVRFRWGEFGNMNSPSHYYWMIDDLEIQVPAAHEISSYDSGLKCSFNSDYSSGDYFYSKVPLNQVVPTRIYGSVRNTGANSETNLIQNTTVYDEMLSVAFSGSSNSLTINSGDTLADTITTPWSPGLGEYRIVNNFTYDNIASDADPSNNSSDTIYYEVTQAEFALDNFDHVLADQGGLVMNSSNQAIALGNAFRYNAADTIRQIKFSLMQTGNVNFPFTVYPIVIRIDSSIQGGYEIISENATSYTITGPSMLTPTLSNAIWHTFDMGNGVPVLAGEEYFVGVVSELLTTTGSRINPVVFDASIEHDNLGFVKDNTGEYQLYLFNEVYAVRAIMENPIHVTANIVNHSTCKGVCDGEVQTMVSGTGPFNYQWYQNGNVMPGETNAHIQNVCFGEYVVHVTDQQGNNAYDTVFVDTLTSIAPDFSITNSYGEIPHLVLFENLTPLMLNVDFTWNFGEFNDTIFNSIFLAHTYLSSGIRNVSLMAHDTVLGCMDTISYNLAINSVQNPVCTHSALISGPSNHNVCVADSLILSCNSSPGFEYQWYVDGNPIHCETHAEILVITEGAYKVVITENGCSTISDSVLVTIDEGLSPANITQTGTFNGCIGGTVNLDAGVGYNSYLWNTGETTSSINPTSSGEYWVITTDGGLCPSISGIEYLNASNVTRPEICVVTVDTSQNHIVLLWEKPITTAIDSFYIYRKSEIGQDYTKFGATDYSDLGIWADLSSEPESHGYSYKISVLDTCGIETNLSEEHKSIHLTLTALDTNTNLLSWCDYRGLNFNEYKIYRGTSLSNMTLLATVPFNITAYFDMNVLAGTSYYYQIVVDLGSGCDPSKQLYYSANSNAVFRENDSNVGLSEIESSFKVYPNPSKGIFIVNSFSTEYNNVEWKLYNSLGQFIKSNKLKFGAQTIDLSGYPNGMYFFSILTEKNPIVLKLLKE
ncbi:MAG: T9SS type A sorting domain-containing protein [Crocinitomicaceae bacterium]